MGAVESCSGGQRTTEDSLRRASPGSHEKKKREEGKHGEM